MTISGLKELTLSANPAITSKGWSHLFMGIAANSTLKVLNLDYNNISDYGAGCLAVALASNHTLDVLDLEGCGINEFGGQVCIISFYKCLLIKVIQVILYIVLLTKILVWSILHQSKMAVHLRDIRFS